MPTVSLPLHQNGIKMIINEEGKLKHLPVTAILTNGDRFYDTLQGDILFTSHDNSGNITGLTDSQIDVLKGILKDKVRMMGLGLIYNIPVR